MATAAKTHSERSITTATQRIKLSVTARLPTGETKSWSLLKPVTVIGSRRHAQIIIREEHVNRSHAAIVNTGAHVLLVDLFSDAGTYCSGGLVTRALLKDGDVVRVGSTDLQISIELPPNPIVPRRGIVAFDDPLKMPKAMRLVQVDTDEGWEIVDSTAIIGNCKQAAVGVYADGIARAHSLIFATINGIGIVDLGSSTPLKINGNEKQMAYLKRQDRLLIGKAGLMVQFPKEGGGAQAGRRKGLPGNATGDESRDGSGPAEVSAQSHRQTEDGSLVNRGIEARAVGGSAVAVMDSSEVPFTEQPELESLGSKISALQEELAGSWGEINEWKKKLTLEHNNLTVREQELQNKETELRLLAAEVEHRGRKAADQEQQCERQQSEIATGEVELEKARAGLDGRDLEIREQRAKLATVTSELETRQRECEQRQSEIAGRKAELEKIKAEVEHRSSKVADQEHQCEQQQSEIAAREAELEKIKADLDGRDLDIREQQATLTAVAGELETRQKDVERFAAEYDTVRQEIESRRLELETLENSMAEERSRLENEQQSMSELSEETAHKSQELCDRESNLSSREEATLQRRTDLESNLRELEARHEEIGARESRFIDCEEALQKRHAELVGREQQIHQRSEIITRFKQFIEEANEAYDVTVNSSVDPAPDTIPVLPESEETPPEQSRADATAELNRARREMRAAVSDLETETRQMAEGLSDAEAGNEGPPAVDPQSLEPEVRDRFRALKRIGSNAKSDAELIEQIHAELLKEGDGSARRQRKKKAWWKG